MLIEIPFAWDKRFVVLGNQYFDICSEFKLGFKDGLSFFVGFRLVKDFIIHSKIF